MAPVLGKYKTLTLAGKMSLLQNTDKNSECKGKLTLKYGMPNSSLSTILTNHHKIEGSFYKFKESASCLCLWP
jgi:hypothetical protein